MFANIKFTVYIIVGGKENTFLSRKYGYLSIKEKHKL